MGALSGAAICDFDYFPHPNASYCLYIVSFAPLGYAVLHSDDRLPLVVAFSNDSYLNLSDQRDNAFYSALLLSLLDGESRLALPAAGEPTLLATPLATNSEQYGPYLTTTWSQTTPYNLYAPAAPNSGYGYDGRAPIGCVPIAFAQLMRYHAWPPYGHGSHSYEDTEGTIQGAHSADFAQPIVWQEMGSSYRIALPLQPGATNMADLIYRLAVAGEVNFEGSGSGANITQTGRNISHHLYYEQPVDHSDADSLTPALQADLKAGLPAVVAIPGHAIVADGLLLEAGQATYHINYGWGGQNNGWYSATAIPNGALEYGVSGMQPALVALPQQQAVTAVAGSTTLQRHWLPSRRCSGISGLQLEQLEPQSGSWSSDAGNLDHVTPGGWELSPAGYSGTCWHAARNGPKRLVLADRFVPTGNSKLTFRAKCQVALNDFRVLVSTDGWYSYEVIHEEDFVYNSVWSSYSLSLGAYAAERIELAFELTYGQSYYPNGGVWLDDLAVSSTTWQRWESVGTTTELAVDKSGGLAALLPAIANSGSYTMSIRLLDTTFQLQPRSPPFQLDVIPATRFTYRQESDGSITITGYYGSDEKLLFPETWDGQVVSGLATDALYGRGVVDLLFPATVTRLEAGAFNGTAGLRSVMFSGAAPTLVPATFGPLSATLYRLPGSSGWGETLAGQPVLLWNPAPLAAPTPGFSNSQFGFTIGGTPAICLSVETATGLRSPSWTTITNIMLDSHGRACFTDPTPTPTPQRFYRLVWP